MDFFSMIQLIRRLYWHNAIIRRTQDWGCLFEETTPIFFRINFTFTKTQDYLLKGLNNHCEDNNQIRHNNRFSPLCTVENYLQNNLNYVSQRLNDYQQGLTNTPLSLSKSRSLEIQSLLNRYSSSRNRPEPTPSSSPSPASSEEHISTTAVSSVQLHAPNPASQFEDARQHFRSRRLQPSVRPILPRAFPTVIIHPGNHPTSLPPSFLNASIATTTVPLDSFEQTFQEYNKLWGRNPRKYIHFTPSRQMCKNLWTFIRIFSHP